MEKMDITKRFGMALPGLLDSPEFPLLDELERTPFVDPVVEFDQTSQGLAGEDETPRRFLGVDEPRLGLLVVAEDLLAAGVFGIHHGAPVREGDWNPEVLREAYQSADRSVNATGVNPLSTPASWIRTWVAALFALVSVLPARAQSGSPEPDNSLPSMPVPSAELSLDGSALTALLYRSPLGGSEGVVVFAGADSGLWDRFVVASLDRGVSALVLPEGTSISAAGSAYAKLESHLGDGASLAVAAEGPECVVAWQLVRASSPGAVLFLDSHAELVPSALLQGPGGRQSMLLLASEDDYLARERARNLCVAASESVDLWLVDRAGAGWTEVLSRPDVSSDLAQWCLRALEATRAARKSPMVDRTEVAR